MLTASDLLYIGLMFVWAVLLGVVTFENKLYVFIIIWVGLTYVISNARSLELVIRIIAFALFVNIYIEIGHRIFRKIDNLLRHPNRNWRVVFHVHQPRVGGVGYVAAAA